MHDLIDHRSAWRAIEFRSKDDYSFDLSGTHLAELRRALENVKEGDLPFDRINPATFDLPTLGAALEEIRREVTDGRGFVLIRGFPVGHYPLEDIETLYYGLGAHLGAAESQSVMGDRIGHVVDTSDQDPNARAYRNKQELGLHTDLCDVITMLSVSKAAVGGVSRYVSAVACHNAIHARNQKALDILFRGFHMYRVGEHAADELPYTPHRVPIFSMCDDHLSIRYIRAYIHAAATQRGEPLTEDEVEALDLLDEVAQSEELMLEIALEPGEISVINNYTVMHARSAFENDPSIGKIRHLLRLWLTVSNPRPVVPEINLFDTPGISFKEGRRPSGEGELLRSLTTTE